MTTLLDTNNDFFSLVEKRFSKSILGAP